MFVQVQQDLRGCMLRGYAAAGPPAAKPSAAGDVTEKGDWEDIFDGIITSDEARRELGSLRTAISNFTAKVQEGGKVWITFGMAFWDLAAPCSLNVRIGGSGDRAFCVLV
jgi:hypothetical protein